MAVDQNRIRISMERSGFREVTEDISKLNIALDSLHKAIMGMVKIGDVAEYFDKFGSKLAGLNDKLYPQKLIDYREALYKVGITANDSQKSITKFGNDMEAVSQKINMSKIALVELHSKMMLTPGFVNQSSSAITKMIESLKKAGVSDAGAAAIQATVARVTGGSSTMTQALMSGDANAMQAAQQKLFQSGDVEGQQNLQMLQDSLSGKKSIVDRDVFKGQAAVEAAKANKELTIATASENFIESSNKFAAAVEAWVGSPIVSKAVAGGKKIGAWGNLAKDVEQFMFGLADNTPGGKIGGGAGSSKGGGKSKTDTANALATKIGFAGTALASGAILGADYLGTKSHDAAWAANNAGQGNPGGSSAAMVGASRGQSNIDLAVTNSWLNKNNVEIQKNIDIMKSQGAIDRTIQTATKAKLPNMEQELVNLKKIYDQTVQYKGLDAAETTQALSNWKAKKQEIAETIKFVTDYKMTLQQTLVTELNPARMELIKTTTNNMGEQIDMLKQLAASDFETASSMAKNRNKKIADLKASGMNEQQIKEAIIQYDKEIVQSKTAGYTKQKELVGKYKLTGGMETGEFERGKGALDAINQMQSILPTALGSMLSIKKQMLEVTRDERDAAYDAWQLSVKRGDKIEIQYGYQMDYMNKAIASDKSFMELTGNMTDQIQMALGSIHEATGGFEETMPRLAEQGAMIKEQMGALYAPQFKYGGYGGGQDITTLTASSYMTSSDNKAVNQSQLEQAVTTNDLLRQIKDKPTFNIGR